MRHNISDSISPGARFLNAGRMQERKLLKMYIDMHTHIFPDALARRAIENLERIADEGSGREGSLKACTDGTYNGLIDSMKRCGIDASLILPVMTKPSQFDTVNRYAAEINGKNGIYSFGGMHPDCENVEEKLDFIKSLGLKGIKLHPDYQRCAVDDERYLKIVRHCLKLGLYVTFHAGYDIGYPEPMYCRPDVFRSAYMSLLQEFEEEKHPHIILAHLGGVTTAEKTMKYLCGLPIYLDLAFTFGVMREEDIAEIIRLHGAQKILFASDSPWSDQGRSRVGLEALPISAEEKELISHKNAEKILGVIHSVCEAAR